MNRHETPFAPPDQRPGHLIPIDEGDAVTVIELPRPVTTDGNVRCAIPGEWMGMNKVPTACLEMCGDNLICD